MRCRSPKSLLKNICKRILPGGGLLLVASLLWAFPDTERVPQAPSTLTQPPLNLFNDQPDDFVVASDGNTAFFAVGDDIVQVDLESWDLADEQVPDLDVSESENTVADEAGDIKGLAISGSRLYATQDDGDLVIIDLDDLTAEPTVVKLDTNSPELGKIVADTEGGSSDDQLYIADQTNKKILVFDIGDNEVVATQTLASGGVNREPGKMLFVPLTDQDDKVYVATNEGFLFVITEGGKSIATIDIDSTGGNDLVGLAVSTTETFVFVLDNTDKLLHVIKTSDNSRVTASDIPMELDTANGDLRDITVAAVENPNDVYAFIAGSEGVTIIDLDISQSSFDDFEFLDFGTDPDDDDEPLALAGNRTPQDILAPRTDYVLTINTDTTMSVLSERPFVTITANSLGGGTLGVGGSFALTFEADAAGTYSVRIGGDTDSLGTEVDSGTVAAADTAVTTNNIDYDSNSGAFQEGNNDVFVFVTDTSQTTNPQGHDKVVIRVDTPPPQVTLTSTGFGNTRAYINFDRLNVSDIASYNLYAETTLAGVQASTNVRATALQPSSGGTIQGVIPGLTNGQTYFLAVEAVDQGGNIGVRNETLENGNLAVATPQVTIGIAGASGEEGCQLIRSSPASRSSVPAWFLCLLVLMVLGGWRWKPKRASLFVIVFTLLTAPAQAEEVTPQWFSFEFKIGEWLPADNITDDFLTTCCNERYEFEFGVLLKSKYGFEVAVGFVTEGRDAIGAISGTTSQDRFNFSVIPIQNNLTFRADFKENQILVPYVKAGPDYWIFRENLRGDVTKGVKYGFHGTVGLQILMEFGHEGEAMELDWGVNDVYFTLEGEYAYVNSFGANGLDLSGWLFSAGVLFEF